MATRDRLANRVFSIKGRGGEGIPYTAPPKKQQIVVRGRAVGTAWQYMIGVDAGKQLIMDGLKVQQPGSKYCHFPRNEGTGYGAAYFTGLLSERLVYRQERKNPWVWEKIPGHERNEALDCRNYANAAFKALAPDLDAVDKRLKQMHKGIVPEQTPTESRPAKTLSRQSVAKYYDEW